MWSAVQLRSIPPRAELLCGAPHASRVGSQGSIAIFRPGAIVAYLISYGPLGRLFLFRTLAVREPGVAIIPGVHPGVRLLVDLRAKGRIDRVEKLLAWLERREIPPTALSDGFWLRISHVLGGQLPSHKVTAALLSKEVAAARGASSQPEPGRLKEGSFQ